MKKFKISENQGYAYSIESRDKNKIHLDNLTGYNSIFNHKIVHGTLIFLKILKEMKYQNLNQYSINIQFVKAFKYNVLTNYTKKKIFQRNFGLAYINFSKKNDNVLFLLSLIIFLSPYFRSSTVWITTDNLALLFFLLSINSFLSTRIDKKSYLKNSFLCFFFLILASYIRQSYALFFILYFISIQSKLKLLENFYVEQDENENKLAHF